MPGSSAAAESAGHDGVLNTALASTASPRRLGVAGLSLLWLVAVFYVLSIAGHWTLAHGYDSHAYWAAWRHGSMYGTAPNHRDAFLYSPLFAQAIWPLTLLPWPVFFAVWTVAGFAMYAWLLWPLELRWRAPLLLLCVPQVIIGNVWPLFALVLVVGFRRPWMWAAPVLVKLTSGFGIVWFAARREWRSLVLALAATCVLAAVSAAISPGLWAAWFHLLAGGGSAIAPSSGAPNVPFPPRFAVALVLAMVGARRGQVALLIAAVALGSPVFALSPFLSNLFVFTSLPRLRREPVVSRCVPSGRS